MPAKPLRRALGARRTASDIVQSSFARALVARAAETCGVPTLLLTPRHLVDRRRPDEFKDGLA